MHRPLCLVTFYFLGCLPFHLLFDSIQCALTVCAPFVIGIIFHWNAIARNGMAAVRFVQFHQLRKSRIFTYILWSHKCIKKVRSLSRRCRLCHSKAFYWVFALGAKKDHVTFLVQATFYYSFIFFFLNRPSKSAIERWEQLLRFFCLFVCFFFSSLLQPTIKWTHDTENELFAIQLSTVLHHSSIRYMLTLRSGSAGNLIQFIIPLIMIGCRWMQHQSNWMWFARE